MWGVHKVGKACTCCKFTCPECATCNRKIKSFDFKFSNKNLVPPYEASVLVDRMVNDPCLKYFYIGDATGYYKQDGTRVAYKGYRMEITPTPGTQFSKDLVACNRGAAPIFNLSNVDTIVTVQKVNGKFIITFPDERFFFKKFKPFVDPGFSAGVRFLYDNNKKMEFIFGPWDFQKFQNDLRNYESLDPSLVGKYPELKNCTVNLTSYDLPQGPSLNLSTVDDEIVCSANFYEYNFYDYIHRRGTCFIGCLGELTYESKLLTQRTWPDFFYFHKHAKYKKTYHGFLIVLDELNIGNGNFPVGPGSFGGIFPNISEELEIYPDGNTRYVWVPIKRVDTYNRCKEDPTCNPIAGFATICDDQLIEKVSEEGVFDGDMSIRCPSCRTCVDIVNIRRTASKPTTLITDNNMSAGFTIGSGLVIETPKSETVWQGVICCCLGKNEEILRKDTYFDFAFSSMGGENHHPGFNYSRCPDLSIVSEAQVKINLEDLEVKNPDWSTPGGAKRKCLEQLPGQFFQYTIGSIPTVSEFELTIGTAFTYTLKGSTDFSSENTQDQWVGNSTDFIGAINEYETGISDCQSGDSGLGQGIKDSRISKSISWFGLNDDFNFISRVETVLDANWFLSQEAKKSSNYDRILQYKKQTGVAIEFTDRINAQMFSDLWYLPTTAAFSIRPIFLTNLQKIPGQRDFLPAMSGLKMYVELIVIGDRISYSLRSNTIDINNSDDIYSTFIIDQEVGIFIGSILDPGGPRFIRDPVFSRPILVSLK